MNRLVPRGQHPHRSRRPSRLAAVTVLALWATTLLVGGTPAAAADPPAAGKPDQDCIDVGLSRKLGQWMCLGGVLSYETTAVVDGAATTVWHQERVSEILPHIDSGDGATPAADDYDYWCEYYAICHRRINAYAEETKGNAAYFVGTTRVGEFDIVIRTNLNGRQGQWRVTLIWDSGPPLTFNDVLVLCREDQFGPDPICGSHRAGRGIQIGPTGWRWKSPTLYGNRLNDPNDYYAQVTGYFTPSGYQRYTMSPLETSRFRCEARKDTCSFPE